MSYVNDQLKKCDQYCIQGELDKASSILLEMARNYPLTGEEKRDVYIMLAGIFFLNEDYANCIKFSINSFIAFHRSFPQLDSAACQFLQNCDVKSADNFFFYLEPFYIIVGNAILCRNKDIHFQDAIFDVYKYYVYMFVRRCAGTKDAKPVLNFRTKYDIDDVGIRAYISQEDPYGYNFSVWNDAHYDSYKNHLYKLADKHIRAAFWADKENINLEDSRCHSPLFLAPDGVVKNFYSRSALEFALKKGLILRANNNNKEVPIRTEESPLASKINSQPMAKTMPRSETRVSSASATSTINESDKAEKTKEKKKLSSGCATGCMAYFICGFFIVFVEFAFGHKATVILQPIVLIFLAYIAYKILKK